MEIFLQLRVFSHIANGGTFRSAATCLNISPANATRLISALEERLKTRVLIRTTRSISLTTAGARYLEAVELFLHALREFEYRFNPSKADRIEPPHASCIDKLKAILAMRCFLCAAEQRNLTRAVASLNISRAAFWRLIGELEEQLNTRLLTRAPCAAGLTETGARSIDDFRRLLVIFDRSEIDPAITPAYFIDSACERGCQSLQGEEPDYISTQGVTPVRWWLAIEENEERLTRAVFEQEYKGLFGRAQCPCFARDAEEAGGEYLDLEVLRAWKTFKIGWFAHRQLKK